MLDFRCGQGATWRRKMGFQRVLRLLSSALALAAFLVAAPAHALILDSEHDLVFNEYVTEDVYLAGGTVILEQDIEGDLFVAGGTVIVNGRVSGDVFVGAGTVTVNGEVVDDVRLLGGSISVNGHVGGDLIAMGGDLDVQPSASIDGDLVLLAGSVDLYGTINKSVQGLASRLTLGGIVHGNVNVRVAEKLILLRSGQIDGDLTYFAPQKIEEHGGTIGGTTSFNSIDSTGDRIQEGLRDLFNRGQWIGALWSYLALLLIGSLFVALFPHLFLHVRDTLHHSALKSFGMGFLVFVLGGFAAALLLFTIIGVPLAFMGLSFLFILGEVGRVMAAYGLGSLLIRQGLKRGAAPSFGVSFAILALGLFLFKVIGLIPYVGWIAGFVFFLLGAGALVLVQRENYQFMRKERRF